MGNWELSSLIREILGDAVCMTSMCNEICSLLDENFTTESIEVTDGAKQLTRQPFFPYKSESESKSDTVKIPSYTLTRIPTQGSSTKQSLSSLTHLSVQIHTTTYSIQRGYSPSYD